MIWKSRPSGREVRPGNFAFSASLLFLSRSVAVQAQEHQKRFCRRPLGGGVSLPCSSRRRWGCRRPPSRAGGRPPSPPPSGWSGLTGGLGCLGFRVGVGVGWINNSGSAMQRERGRRKSKQKELWRVATKFIFATFAFGCPWPQWVLPNYLRIVFPPIYSFPP